MKSQARLVVILHADVVGSTTLVQLDERVAHERMQSAFQRFSNLIQAHGGITHELRGDALVAEFSRASDAVSAAVEFQGANATSNEGITDDIVPMLRVGISLGEVIVADGTVTGSGVALAQRVEQLASANGICITAAVHEAIPKRLPFKYESLGDRTLKGFQETVRVYRIVEPGSEHEQQGQQRIRFCTTREGVRIAYAEVGQGPPIVKTANWLNHLEYDWESPVWRHMFEELSRDHLLIRYDARGNGLSDWDVDEISFEAFVRDLETVVEETGLERFALLGISQGCAISIAYAARHPERVSHLILYGGFAKGWRRSNPKVLEKWQALNALMRQGWGKGNPAFRQMFTAMFMPGATPEQMNWFNELQRVSTSPENALRIRDAVGDIDVEALLPTITVPAIVLHAREDEVVPFKSGRELAMGIPRATFVPLESQNHLLLEAEPAWRRFMTEVKNFLATGERSRLV